MASEFEWDRVQRYLDQLAAPRPAELSRMEQIAKREGFPIIGPVCGQLCYQMARTIGAKRIFELGSGFGYSTAWFARAVHENGGGVVHHVVWDDDLSGRARAHLAALGLEGVVTFHVGEAVETLRRIEGPFDIVFIDIDKDGYPAALDEAAGKVRPGGLIMADNVLWHGRIFDPADQSAPTEGIREFTRRLVADPAWIATIVPARDGMMIATRLAG